MHTPEKSKCLKAALVGVFALSSLVSAEPDTPRDSPETEVSVQPLNVINIVVDDMNDFSCKDTHKFLPKSSKWLIEKGICYENATATSPVCCPARAIIQTGQLAHNNGVMKQSDADKITITDTIQHNVGRAGIATYGTGKFLNGVNVQKISNGEAYVGFQDHDFWSDYDYRGFEVVGDDGNYVNVADDVHTTEMTGENVSQFVKSKAASGESFYVYAAYYAPHTQRRSGSDESAFSQPTDRNAAAEVPALNFQPEQDASDKLPIFNEKLDDKTYYKGLHRARVRALYDVDDQVSEMFQTLEEQGLSDNTAVFFMSDNGYSLGQHNWKGKAVPYNESINIPMLAYIPTEETAGSVDTRDVGLVDIAPTIYDLYNITSTPLLDGHSLISSYERQDGQFYQFVNDSSGTVKREAGAASLRVPSWQMYRRENEAYIEYYNKDGTVLAREFYDSPEQLENLLYAEFDSLRPSEQKLRYFKYALERARTCAGTVEVNAANPCL